VRSSGRPRECCRGAELQVLLYADVLAARKPGVPTADRLQQALDQSSLAVM
jgi:hypothetical protein